jgi:hypothetical protein
MSHELHYFRDYVQGVQCSLIWRLLMRYDHFIASVFPPFSRRRIIYDRLLIQFKQLLGMRSVTKSTATPVEPAQPKPVLPKWPAELPRFQWPEAPQVSIIMLVHNQEELTHQCLKSLEAFTRLPYELIVIANASDTPPHDELLGVRRRRLGYGWDKIACSF